MQNQEFFLSMHAKALCNVLKRLDPGNSRKGHGTGEEATHGGTPMVSFVKDIFCYDDALSLGTMVIVEVREQN